MLDRLNTSAGKENTGRAPIRFPEQELHRAFESLRSVSDLPLILGQR